MALQADLLRAPSRKRKPECAITRKPRIVKMTWDDDRDKTETLLKDLGVSRLQDSDDEEEHIKHSRLDEPRLVSKQTVIPTKSHIQTLGPCGVYLSQLSPPLSHCDVIRVNDASWLVRKPLSARFSSTTEIKDLEKMGNQESTVSQNHVSNYDWNIVMPHIKSGPDASRILFYNRLTNQDHTPVGKRENAKRNQSAGKKHIRQLNFDDKQSHSDSFLDISTNYSENDPLWANQMDYSIGDQSFPDNQIQPVSDTDCGLFQNDHELSIDTCLFETVPDCPDVVAQYVEIDNDWSADPWNKLSDEMMLNVFKWLPKTTLVRCLQVCRRWNRLGLDETLWRRLDLTNKTMKQGEMGTVLDRGVAVLRLAKSTIHAPIYQSISQEVEQFCKVQYLDLSMSSSSPEALEQVIGACHILRKLSLENCKINNAVCRAIGQNRHLEVLNLNMCEGITETGLVPICNNLQKLDALNMGWTNMSKGALVYLVMSLSSSLTKLNLAGCRDTLQDEDIQQLCSSCPNLKELDLSDATLLTGVTVELMALLLRGLEYVALSRCYHVMPSYLPLLAHIPTLLALDVFGMLKESAVYQLREAMPNIEVNKFPFTSIARPTTGVRRTSIWGLRVRDSNV